MAHISYFDDHPFAGAFIAARMLRLANLISDQGNEMLASAGVEVPSRCVSMVLFIKEHGGASAAAMAAGLELQHQLVTQRIALLIKLGLVEKSVDPSDARQKRITLSPKGEAQFPALEQFLKDASHMFQALEHEIDASLSVAIERASEALKRRPLAVRIQDHQHSDKNTTR